MHKISNFRKIVIIAPAFGKNPNLKADLNASRRKFSGWHVDLLGQWQPFKSLIDSKIIATKQFLEINKGKYEWAIILDSTDCIFCRNYEERELLHALYSFKKKAVFAGETELYPLKELDGLYASPSSIRYLNSGVMAIHCDFVEELLSYTLNLFGNSPYYANIGYEHPSDQAYFNLALFSKEVGEHIAVDEQGVFAVCTKNIPNNKFRINNNRLLYENSSPFILHFRGHDKFARKKEFMSRLQII